MKSKSITDRIDKKFIENMVRAIVREVDPERVYLFGSAARNDGEVAVDSDVDFLVVKNKSFERPSSRLTEVRRIRRAVSAFHVAKDILVYNSDEIEKWRDSTNHIIGTCLREGKLVYERH